MQINIEFNYKKHFFTCFIVKSLFFLAVKPYVDFYRTIVKWNVKSFGYIRLTDLLCP